MIDGSTNEVTSTISVGTNPYAVAVNPSTNTVYVTNADDNTVSVINGSTNAVTSTISVGSYPYGVAVNPSTNTVYVTNADDNTVSVITQPSIKSTPTTPSISNLPNSGIYGDSFTPTVSTTGDGTKSVTSSTTSVCTVTAGTVNYIGVGTCTLVAHVGAGANYTAADGLAQSFTIGAATPSGPTKVTPPTDRVIYFSPGSAVVSPAGIVAIRTFVAAAASHVAAISITGYASKDGPLAFNMALSRQRANAVAMIVRETLSSLRVHGVRVDVIAGGVRTVAPTEAGNRVAMLHAIPRKLVK